MVHETYLSIFGDNEGSLIYNYLLFEHVWFIYVADFDFIHRLVDLTQ